MYDIELVKEILHAEVVYSVCENHIEVLTQTVQVMLADLEKR